MIALALLLAVSTYPAPLRGEVCYFSETVASWVCISFKDGKTCFRTAAKYECVPPPVPQRRRDG